MRIYVDTNAFISALEGDDVPSGHVRAILAKAGQAKIEFCSSELSLGELLVEPLRHDDRDRAEVILSLFGPSQTLMAGSIDRDIVVAAADLRASYRSLKWPDAIHLATAIRHDCSHFLSNDRRLPRLEGMDFVHLTEAHLQKLLAEIALEP